MHEREYTQSHVRLQHCDHRVEKIVLSENVRIVSALTFSVCKHLTHFETRGPVVLGEDSFTACVSLVSVVLAEGTVLKRGVFDTCHRLVHVTLPSDLRVIPPCCFSGCASLQSIHLPSTVREIGACAFSQCYSLRRICLPEGLLEIHLGAFEHTRLIHIVIPKSVTFFGRSVFRLCKQLRACVISCRVVHADTFIGCEQLLFVVSPMTHRFEVPCLQLNNANVKLAHTSYVCTWTPELHIYLEPTLRKFYSTLIHIAYRTCLPLEIWFLILKYT